MYFQAPGNWRAWLRWAGPLFEAYPHSPPGSAPISPILAATRSAIAKFASLRDECEARLHSVLDKDDEQIAFLAGQIASIEADMSDDIQKLGLALDMQRAFAEQLNQILGIAAASPESSLLRRKVGGIGSVVTSGGAQGHWRFPAR